MFKIRKCKHCGRKIQKNVKRCPYCNKKVKRPIVTLLCTLILLFALFLIYAVLSDSLTTGNNAGSSNKTLLSYQDNISTKTSTSTIADNEYITAEFVEYNNQPSLGVFYTVLRVTNKTDKKIWVYLDDASVNDEMIQVLAGTPLYILPEKKGTSAFIFSFSQISIDSFDDVEKISFKIAVKNEETLADIYTSDEITLSK